MQFLIMAHDFPDALPRRMACRQAHLDLHAVMAQEGKTLYAAALMTDAGEMKGSMIVCDFPDRSALDAFLAAEPYVQGKVWDKIDVTPCKTGPLFMKNQP